ncbi:MAG: lactate utilization protein B [Prolixibacteraceae bacterium]|jgi:L-lactate dehydrogenase complex protein LldF|nr:lactate utilization protein B [Prolixibacteraceae bacterium]
MNAHRQFIQASKKKAFDIEHRNKLKYNISQYEKSFKKGLSNYDNIELAKEFISTTKGRAVENLSELLIRFENNIASRGTHVIWAFDKKEALSEIDKILQKHQVKMVVKSKSMISEELDLNHFLEKKGVEPVETDLGEFIVQLEDEPPYHILTPAMHKSKEDVAKLFHHNFGTPPNETPEKLTAFTRKKIREKYVNAGAGITGANFLVADIGAVALTENEGNGIMSLAFPKVHIVIAGIEKVIATTSELGKVWPVLAQYGTGQQLTVYNSLITGPRCVDEMDGPEHMYVILLDNKRSVLYQPEPQKKALECIRCGACLNACPIYKNIGGHAYKTPYTGPIGSVISPIYRGTNFDHLATACTLCGRCTEVCPAKIPLHELILYNRQMSKKYKWHFFLKIFRLIASDQNKLDMFNSWFKNIIFKLGIYSWGRHRIMPKFEKQTFSIYWKKRLKHN